MRPNTLIITQDPAGNGGSGGGASGSESRMVMVVKMVQVRRVKVTMVDSGSHWYMGGGGRCRW